MDQDKSLFEFPYEVKIRRVNPNDNTNFDFVVIYTGKGAELIAERATADQLPIAIGRCIMQHLNRAIAGKNQS